MPKLQFHIKPVRNLHLPQESLVFLMPPPPAICRNSHFQGLASGTHRHVPANVIPLPQLFAKCSTSDQLIPTSTKLLVFQY